MSDPKIIKDQESILSGGMHGSLHPAAVPRGQYSRGINLACRGGYVTTRPGWSHVKDLGTKLTPFQGASRWRPGNTEYLVSVFNGSAFFYDIEGGTVTTFPGVVTAGPRVCMAQADVLLVMGTGDSVAVFSLDVDGVPTKVYPLANPESGKLQPCSIMHYCQGRLHSVPQMVGVGEAAIAAYDRYFVSGDILQPGTPSTIYNAAEAGLINGGGALGLPDELGPIRGMISAQSPGKGTGVGPLLVFARNGIAAFDVGISPRASVVSAEGVIQERGWYDQQIGSVLNYGTGTDSPWSLVVAGTDVWFRGRDGIYSFKRTVANAQSGLMDVNPESYEVKRWMDPETNAAGVSGATVDRRLFMTAISDGADGFMGVVSLDQAVSSTLGTPTPPAYDGLWTGPRIAKIVEASRQGKPTLFAVTTDAQVYWLDPTADTDSGVEIVSQLVTRAMFSDPEMRNPYKRLMYADLWLSDITRTTSVDLYFRPDGYPLWTKMGCTKTLAVATDSLPQERRRMRFALRDGAFCENDRRPGMNSGSVRHGFMYQIKVVLTGCARITRLETAAAIVDEESPSQETTDTVQSFAIVPNACHFADDDFTQSAPGTLSFDGGWVRGTRAEAGVGIPDVAWPPQYTRQVLPPGPVGPQGPKGDQGEPGTLLALEDASRWSIKFDPTAEKIQLNGDVLQPNGNSYYGVGSDGTRTWYEFAALPQHSLQFNELDDKIELVGDEASPAANTVYGVDGSGNRGWQALPTPSSGQKSVELDAETNNFQLVGDTASPGASKVYGTDSSGTRGWQTASSGSASGWAVTAHPVNPTLTLRVGTGYVYCDGGLYAVPTVGTRTASAPFWLAASPGYTEIDFGAINKASGVNWLIWYADYRTPLAVIPDPPPDPPVAIDPEAQTNPPTKAPFKGTFVIVDAPTTAEQIATVSGYLNNHLFGTIIAVINWNSSGLAWTATPVTSGILTINTAVVDWRLNATTHKFQMRQIGKLRDVNGSPDWVDVSDTAPSIGTLVAGTPATE